MAYMFTYSGSSGDCKLCLTVVRLSLLPAPETLGHSMDGRMDVGTLGGATVFACCAAVIGRITRLARPSVRPSVSLSVTHLLLTRKQKGKV